jgi:hypothetical protein
MFVKADFLYDPERDIYRCPAGNELTYRYSREEGGLTVARYWINECQHCPLHDVAPAARNGASPGSGT